MAEKAQQRGKMKEKGSRRCKSKVNGLWKPKKRGRKALWANMAGIIVSRLIGIIRDKSKVNGP